MKKMFKGVLLMVFFSVFSINLVSADIPPIGGITQSTIPITIVGVVVVVIALIAWLIIRSIKKKNAKSSK